jgi:hypothetical protein
MNERDQRTENLRCPKCRKTGNAELSQANDRAYYDDGDRITRVESLPDGFKIIQLEYGIDFCCVSCDVPVAP